MDWDNYFVFNPKNLRLKFLLGVYDGIVLNSNFETTDCPLYADRGRCVKIPQAGYHLSQPDRLLMVLVFLHCLWSDVFEQLAELCPSS